MAIKRISSSKCSRVRSTRGSRKSAKYFRGLSISPSQLATTAPHIAIKMRLPCPWVQGRRISDTQQFEQIGVVPSSFEAFSLDAALGGLVLSEQVECDTVEDGEVLRGMAGPFAVEVFGEADIEHPVEFVFDAPVLADEAIQVRGRRLEAGDVVADLTLGFAGGLMVALGLDTHQPL